MLCTVPAIGTGRLALGYKLWLCWQGVTHGGPLVSSPVGPACLVLDTCTLLTNSQVPAPGAEGMMAAEVAQEGVGEENDALPGKSKWVVGLSALIGNSILT